MRKPTRGGADAVRRPHCVAGAYHAPDALATGFQLALPLSFCLGEALQGEQRNQGVRQWPQGPAAAWLRCSRTLCLRALTKADK